MTGQARIPAALRADIAGVIEGGSNGFSGAQIETGENQNGFRRRRNQHRVFAASAHAGISARLRKLASNAEEAGEENSDVLFLSEIMSGWDVVNNGEPFPPTKENLRIVPAALLSVVAQGIVEYVGKQATPAASSN